jgi:exonuclease SbcC
MIPQRILLQGFLCYRDKTEISFEDDSALWMLAGLNGSGKSAVFDAVTYALFGGHRGGQRNAEELVNKESDGLQVEFDFLRSSTVYRIRRTLKKGGRATRQVYEQQPGTNGKDAWHAVESTGNQKGFDEWVRDHIGLSYETFTSSVLLMQGRAEKLLNADASDRRKVLAGIVDLERYELLHERADEQRKKHKNQAETLEQKLNLLPEVTEAELAAAEEQIAAAQAGLDQARAEMERRQRLLVQGERWADLQARLAEANRRWDHAHGLLARAEAIERDWGRLRELRLVLPHLQTIADQRQRLEESERSSAIFGKEREALANQLRELDYAQEQARQKREQHQAAIASDQQREPIVSQRLVELSGVLARVELCERQRQSVALLEADLAKLPPDPSEALQREQEAFEHLSAVSQAVPFLARLQEEREALHSARTLAQQISEQESLLVAKGTKLAVELRNLTPQVEDAVQQRQQCDEETAAARALRVEAGKQLDDLAKLDGARLCRVCGQELTPGHLEEERERRQRACQDADRALSEADKARKAAVKEEKRLLDRKKDLERQIEELREGVRDCRGRRQQAERDAERHQAECGRIYRDLAEPFRLQIGPSPPHDWPRTAYPTAADLGALRLQVRELEGVRQRQRQARTDLDQWNKLHGQLETARRTLAAQETDLPAGGTGARQEHADLQQEDVALKERLKTRRAALTEEQRNLERLEKQQRTVRDQLAERERRLEAEKARQEGYRETLTREWALLPAAWQPEAERVTRAVLQPWEAERGTLEQQGTEAAAQGLIQAREKLEALRQEKANRERELDEVPVEARFPVAELQMCLEGAKAEQGRREDQLGEARNARKGLLERREQRQTLQAEFLAVEQHHYRYRLLAELLGPKRLQLYLVRQAERGIVDFANEVLDRLSGGQLYLRLRGEDSEEAGEKALELEAYNRTAGEAPIGAAFLSGSQRFRVAVSLALGIGQYASRQHRPIESVIIDEGFGCLDRQGRQVMVQELQNLRGQMRCILLVSHQEEFAEAFANGYRFELNNGTTQVTRFQR